MRMYLAGQWMPGSERMEVRRPWDGSILDDVPRASPEDVERAVVAAVQGAQQARSWPGWERCQTLRRAAALLRERSESFARTISDEEGKTLAESQFEVSRAVETLDLSADEARRIAGEGLPLDGAPGGAGKLGFTLRVPCGVVAAITPFNFPLNLVCHKVGPALAAGNSVLIKPASDTPLSALRLTELLLEAGVPSLVIACVTGPGGQVGQALVADPRVRKVSFTGSQAVGETLIRAAGVKRVTLELGSNSPLIVLPDADLGRVVEATVATGFGNAGQTCISTQRLLVVGSAYNDLLERLTPAVASIRAGDPLDPQTRMGPMIRAADAERVERWIDEAVQGGARVVAGGGRSGALHQATLVTDVSPMTRLCCEELFGPAVAVTRVESLEEAVELANDSRYGLSAGIFTQDINAALRFAEQAESGNIHINWGPGWRADLMPYGGLKQSGLGKEGPRYAVESMTETKTVVVHLS